MKDMTWNDAIAQVLKEHGSPMHYREITEAILEQGLRTKVGATPSNTVATQLSMDLAKGASSRFIYVAKSTYGLRDWRSVTDVPATEEEALSNTPQAAVRIAVRAYGMYWERALVDWLKSAPRLMGQQFKNSDLVDHYEQQGIYVLYDHRTIVYVGRATSLSIGDRLRDHTLDRLRSRWDRFSWFGLRGVREDGSLTTMDSASASLEEVISQMEAVFIELLEPPQNRQQGKGLAAIEYLQSEDPELVKRRKKELLKELEDRL